MSSEQPLMEVEGLKKYFTQGGVLSRLLPGEAEGTKAVDDVTLSLYENESKAIIGESGCGKTTLLKLLIGLLDPTAGELRFRGKDMSDFNKSDWKEFRQNVQMVFQDPFNTLDPKFTVKESLMEPLIVHGMADREERVRTALRDVELTPPENYIDRVPKMLSGGEKQRVAIARALIVEPDILLADEPASMLDVSIQASILNLLSELIDDLDLSLIYISHDISTVSYVCEQINVMYLGRIIETAPTKELINDPKHPYSQALINAIPIPDPHTRRARTELAGSAEDMVDIGPGCRFRDRCPERMEVCEKTPVFHGLDERRSVACHLYYDHEQYAGQAQERISDSVATGVDN